ncbi:magnesium transporter NIPA [Streptomyces sp. BK208]|uniref:DMT family transporter n=1 Tax=Streptomyces sp. BK208 TaxID=2512150 RepID=UPI001061516C|nr:DMT family transporter [Streptomyces sp. BK208]TDT42658.1 magnesium transporter NIPA [Streptomyces sp. BK208]
MSALALSVLLSLVSAVAYAGGAIVQEQVAASSPGAQYAPVRHPAWWAAVSLNGLGGLLHVVALALGPLSLVQPLGALTIVFALPMAAFFVGRRAGATAWRGALMATVGLAGLLSLVGASDVQSLSTAQRVAVALVTGGALVALMIAGRAAHRHPAVRSILLATASGMAFGMSSVFTKTVAVDWTGGVSAGDLPSLAVIGILATAGMVLSQASYRGAGLAAPLATLTVVNPVVAAVVGITMFGETFRYGTTGTALALSCGVVAAGGLIMLTTERIAREGAEAEGVLDGGVLDEGEEEGRHGSAVAAVSGGGVAASAAADGAVAVAAATSAASGGGIAPAAADSGAVAAAAANGAVAAAAANGGVAAAVGQAPVAASVVAAPVAAEIPAAPGVATVPVAPMPRLSGKVFVPSPVPSPVPDTVPSEEETYAPRAPVERDGAALAYGSLYGGLFIPPLMLDRRRVRIRS